MFLRRKLPLREQPAREICECEAEGPGQPGVWGGGRMATVGHQGLVRVREHGLWAQAPGV